MEFNWEEFKRENKLMLHYYGDVIRRLLLLGATVMLFTLPLFNHLLPVPSYVSIIAAIVLVAIAGYTNPASRWIVGLGLIISAAAIISFEYFAVKVYYSEHSDWHSWALFWVNHALTFNFLIAFYYGVKTIRGMIRALK